MEGIAPDILSNTEADSLRAELFDLGAKISQLDEQMGQAQYGNAAPQSLAEIQIMHDQHTKRVFEIAQLLEEKLLTAIKNGRGYRPIERGTGDLHQDDIPD